MSSLRKAAEDGIGQDDRWEAEQLDEHWNLREKGKMNII
jgi:hypothetical protein